MTAKDYGKHYWCVESWQEKIYLYADRAEIIPDGHLLFMKENQVTLCLCEGKWKHFYLASPENNKPLAIEIWEKDS